MFSLFSGHEVTKFTNVAGDDVLPAKRDCLVPQPKDALQPSDSARSTLSGRSWITDDKWSDDDEDDDDDDGIASNAAASVFMPKAPASKVAPPIAVLGSHTAPTGAPQVVMLILLFFG